MDAAADKSRVEGVPVVGEVGISIPETVINLTDSVRYHEGRSATPGNGAPVLTVGGGANVRVETASAELV